MGSHLLGYFQSGLFSNVGLEEIRSEFSPMLGETETTYVLSTLYAAYQLGLKLRRPSISPSLYIANI